MIGVGGLSPPLIFQRPFGRSTDIFKHGGE